MARFILEYKKKKFYFDAEQKTDQHVHSDRSSGTEKQCRFKQLEGPLQGFCGVNNPFLKKQFSQTDLQGRRKKTTG